MSGQQRQRADRSGVMDLEKHVDKKIRVKFAGGREVVGVLKGFDQLVNIVLDHTAEVLPTSAEEAAAWSGPPGTAPERTRYLGLVVCRGNNITVICPEDGLQEIENPFVGGEE